MSKSALNLSVDEACQISKKFLKQMAQPMSKVRDVVEKFYFKM